MAGAGAVDATTAFHIALYVLSVETLLFFAVVMHSQTCEPLLHPGVARNFGLFFLFQSASALLLVLAEQLTPNVISHYFALLTVVLIACAVAMSVPAALAVAFPEGDAPAPGGGPGGTKVLPAAVAFSSLLVLCILLLPGGSNAVMEIPYVPQFVRAKILGAMAGAAAVLAAAAAVRMRRNRTGANGALILVAAVSIVAVFGTLWAIFEPACRQTVGNPYPTSCPLPKQFDLNAYITWLIIVCNALAAEGVLRLMQAGDGAQGYTSIQV